MTGLISKVRVTIERYQMLKGGEKVIIGVSGGPDSVCLLHVMLELQAEYKLKLVIAHLNHGLRGEESLRDEVFIKNLARDVNLPCVTTRLDPSQFQKMKGTSLQEKARLLRYAFFHEVLEKQHADKIALGHTADDQAETLLLWLFRGTGTRGLSGIPPVREYVFIRPLIEVERAEIEQFLRQREIDYVQDSSNYENKYLRNRIRRELIPLLKDRYNPQLISTLTQTSNILRAEEEYFQEVLESYTNRCRISKDKRLIVYDVKKLQSFPFAIQLRVLRDGINSFKGNLRQINYKQIISIIQLFSKSGSSNKLQLPGGIQVTKEYDRLIMSKGKKEEKSFLYTFSRMPQSVLIEEIKKVVRFSCLKRGESLGESFSLTADRNTAYLDRSKVCFPLVIRNYKTGDWFYPTGMKGKKKVKDFFIDRKIPVSERRKVPLLMFGDRIAWISGFRVDREMAATLGTKNILKVELI